MRVRASGTLPESPSGDPRVGGVPRGRRVWLCMGGGGCWTEAHGTRLRVRTSAVWALPTSQHGCRDVPAMLRARGGAGGVVPGSSRLCVGRRRTSTPQPGAASAASARVVSTLVVLPAAFPGLGEDWGERPQRRSGRRVRPGWESGGGSPRRRPRSVGFCARAVARSIQAESGLKGL